MIKKDPFISCGITKTPEETIERLRWIIDNDVIWGIDIMIDAMTILPFVIARLMRKLRG